MPLLGISKKYQFIISFLKELDLPSHAQRPKTSQIFHPLRPYKHFRPHLCQSLIMPEILLAYENGTYLYKYVPKLPLAATAAGLWLIPTVYLSWRMHKTRAWFCSSFVAGCVSTYTFFSFCTLFFTNGFDLQWKSSDTAAAQ
jgi:hypothetical protein